MRAGTMKLILALLATTAFVADAEAQSGPCVNDAPNPYKQVNDWAHIVAAWAPTNMSMSMQGQCLVMDRCGPKGCGRLGRQADLGIVCRRQGMKNFRRRNVRPFRTR